MIEIVGVLFITYILLFLVSIVLKDNSIADVFWWVWFIILSIWSLFLSLKQPPQYIISSLVTLWWVRLTFHIAIRKWNERNEDSRYAKWRKEWWSGWYFYVRSFFQIYLLQMLLMLAVALPIFFINLSQTSFEINIWFIVGPKLAFFWLIIESIADYQLKEFIKIKKPGEIFTSWLYRYSRHPNYFWESIFWLGISLIGFSYSYLALIGWWIITFLLLFVSWVPLQEERYKWRPNWEEYKRKTSVFIPWFPKK